MGKYSIATGMFSWDFQVNNQTLKAMSDNGAMGSPFGPEVESPSARKIDDIMAKLGTRGELPTDVNGNVTPDGWGKIGQEMRVEFEQTRQNSDDSPAQTRAVLEEYNNIFDDLKKFSLTKQTSFLASGLSDTADEATNIMIGLMSAKKYDAPPSNDIAAEMDANALTCKADSTIVRMMRGDNIDDIMPDGAVEPKSWDANYACPKASRTTTGPKGIVAAASLARMVEAGPDGGAAFHKMTKHVIGNRKVLSAPVDVEFDPRTTQPPPFSEAGKDGMMHVFEMYQGHEILTNLGMAKKSPDDMMSDYMASGPRAKANSGSLVQTPRQNRQAESAYHVDTQDSQLAFLLDHMFSKKDLDDNFLSSLSGGTVTDNFRNSMKKMHGDLKKGWDKLPDVDKETWASWTAMRQDICGSLAACLFYLFVFGAGAYGIYYGVSETLKQEQAVEDCKQQCTPLQIRQNLPVQLGHTWDDEFLSEEVLPLENADSCWFTYLNSARVSEENDNMDCRDYCEWCEELSEGSGWQGFRRNFVTGFSDPFRVAGEGAGYMGGLVAETGVAAGTPFLEEMTDIFGGAFMDFFGSLGMIGLFILLIVVFIGISSLSG